MEASKDIALLYGKDSRIYRELLGIIERLRNNVKLEDLFLPDGGSVRAGRYY